MRHFEKKGKLGLFRRFDVRASRLSLVIGQAGEGDHRLAIAFRSAAAAHAALERWSRWALDAGYAEVALPDGVTLGVVAYAKTPRGPGRIRLDERVDVQFLDAPFDVEAGDRVMVEGVRRAGKRPADYMFGSTMRATRVFPFPDVKWAAFKPKPEPSAAIRRALEKKAGKALLGRWQYDGKFPRGVEPGDLIFGYEKGIHRFLEHTSTKRGGDWVLSEPVLTSNFKRQSYAASSGAAWFYRPVPPALAREIATRFGL